MFCRLGLQEATSETSRAEQTEMELDVIAHQSNLPALFCYSYVNPEIIKRIKSKINVNDIEFLDTSILLEKQKKIKYKHIDGIGTDRVLGLLGALREKEPPFITVDCGTAITVNVLNQNYECCGGAIFAGISTQMKALNSYTRQLPEIELFPEKITAGRNTHHALRSGIITGTVGAIKELTYRISKEEFNTENITIILTGGDSEIVFNAIDNFDYIVLRRKNLVLDGIIELFEINQWNIEI